MADNKINYLRGLARLYSLGYIHHDACCAFAREDREPVACSDGLIHHPDCTNARSRALDEVLPWREVNWHPETWRMAIERGGRSGPQPDKAPEAKLAKARALLDGYGRGEGPAVNLLMLLGEVRKTLGDGPLAEVEFSDVYRRAKLEAFVKKIAALDDASGDGITDWDSADVYKALRGVIKEAGDLLTDKAPTREEIWAKMKERVREAYAKGLGLNQDASISEIYTGLLGIFTKPVEVSADAQRADDILAARHHEALREIEELRAERDALKATTEGRDKLRDILADDLSKVVDRIGRVVESLNIGKASDIRADDPNKGYLIAVDDLGYVAAKARSELAALKPKPADEKEKDAEPAATHAWLYVSGAVACQKCGAIRMEPETRTCPGHA